MHTRYLAPLNYDRFFKKVFSDLNIAQRFLEDFLNVKIDSIELMGLSYKITDDAVAVEFDYRCQIDGQYVVIDMQQWYKTDIVKRFYVYFALNSVLQLENIPTKSLDLGEERKHETKNYDTLAPAITLIWIVDETLKFKEDFIAYTVLPEQSADFIRNEDIWVRTNWRALKKEHQRVLKILNNDAKNLDFLSKNRLIYAFQKNIVKNSKYSKYLKWFEFAEKTRDPNNKKEDFVKYEKDEIFMAVINRIRTDNLKSEEFQYIDDYEEFRRQVKIHEDVLRKEFFSEGFKEAMSKKDYSVVKNLLINSDFSDDKIALIVGVKVDFVKKLRKKFASKPD